MEGQVFGDGGGWRGRYLHNIKLKILQNINAYVENTMQL